MMVEPHKKISREVKQGDVERVISEVDRMKVVFEKDTCVALAHPQVDDQDPLRFFVTKAGAVFINPSIDRHSGYTVDSVEGCMTYPGKDFVTKQRWRKIVMTYQTLDKSKLLTEKITVDLTGLPAYISQHEIDHLDGVYCYD